MLRQLLALTVLLFTLMLSSCAVIIDNDDEHDYEDEDSVTIIIH